MEKDIEISIEKYISKDPKSIEKDFRNRESDIIKKLDSKKTKLSEIRKLINKLKLIYLCVKDYFNGKYKNIPWKTVAAMVFTLLYWINPFDIIPDFIPFVGYIDDAFVILLVWKAVSSDLKSYAKWKDLPIENYF